jgi:putative transport protein
MDWLINLFCGESIAHTVLLFSFVIAVGIVLGKVKVFGISLGITFVLFVGIMLGHFGFSVNHEVLHFMKEFGLILFVYSIGLQVGPGFFSSLKKGGFKLNMLASSVVFLSILITVIIHFVTGLPISTMVGILSGAVTNTPGLGAAQEAYRDATGSADPTIALGYAVAYPLGVVGIILSLILLKKVFRVNLEAEPEDPQSAEAAKPSTTKLLSLEVKNPSIYGKTVAEIANLLERKFIISRICHNKKEEIEIASSQTVLNENDKIFVVTTIHDAGTITAFIGKEIGMDETAWNKLDNQLLSRRFIITKPELNGKTIRQLRLRNQFGINITRINRSGIDLIAQPGLQLQMGDRVTVVGTAVAVKNVEHILGNKMKRLNEPNLIPIFVGIFLGVLLGSIPFTFPGIPQPVKLGLAGGPLIVAILISIFGPKYKLITYTTMSANLMLREIGICLFLACVGIGAGDGFVETILYKGGLNWIGLGFIITVVPLLIVGAIARGVYRLNFFMLMGLLSGSMTDPPALAYANATAGNDTPAVGYASVYPLTMFLRVLSAQLLVLLFV